MLDSKIKSILIGKHVIHGIRALKSRFSDVEIMGLDTETVNGCLYTIQTDCDRRREFVVADGWKEKEILDWFFSICERGTTLFFAHNLEFDLGVLFPNLCRNEETEAFGYTMKVIYGHPTFMSVHDKHSQKSIQFLNTLMFFSGSLYNVAERLKLPVKKMAHPPCIEENRRPTKAEFEYFKEYAMTDARLTFFLGKEIMKMHREYNINPKGTVSPATLAAKIFRSHFTKGIPYQPKFINYMGLRSYHGGRTESFVYGTTKCKIWDFNSAYPKSMASIPIPLEKKWKRVESFAGEEGFYMLSGEMPMKKVSPMPLKVQRLIFPVGKFRRLIVTGYEAKHIVECAKIKSIKGWVYAGESEESMKNYVDDFYAKKNASKDDPAAYVFNKLMLNSLYGKCLQLNPLNEMQKIHWRFLFDQKKNSLITLPNHPRFMASGMFNPVIASWITGYTRAMLYEKLNEHEKEVLYADTDSVVGTMKCRLPSSDKLGELKFEKQGMATILREKLYIVKQRGKIIKSGLHGFWDSPEKLAEIIQRKEHRYRIARMVKLKEAFVQGKSPFVFETQDRYIDLSPSMKRQIPQGLEDFNFLQDCIELNPIVMA